MKSIAALFPKPSALKRLALFLLLLVLLPALFYSTYEITSLTQNESLLERIYVQQLDAILFSLNQYSWDIANGWASDITRVLQDAATRTALPPGDRLKDFIAKNSGIEAVFVSDSSAGSILLTSTSGRVSPEDFLAAVRTEQSLVLRLRSFFSTGYRKIEGVTIGSGKDSSVCLLFAASCGREDACIVGVVVDAESFIRDVLSRRMTEAGGSEFVLSALRKSDHRLVFSTVRHAPGADRQTRDLWLFPDYVLGIRLQGQTIEDLVRERFYRNIALLAILDFIIIGGVWLIYRTLRREMELAQLKADFVSNVSHELRTPLSLIRMFGETLEMGRVPTEEKKKEYYATIVRETGRLTALVNNVLNFSRMESGRKEYHFALTDLNQVVERVVSHYEPHMIHLGFTVFTQLLPTPLEVRIDEEAVSEALLNILDNAMKYSADDKSIRISTGTSTDGMFVDVEDHGIGIAPEDQPKIFEKFFRSAGGRAHHSKGSGLGLALVWHIMHAQHGSVHVRSQLAKGSTFRLLFPPAAGQHQSEP